MKTLTKEMQSKINPDMAYNLLKEGNKRFINNLKVNRNLLEQAYETSEGQHPFAMILSCIDSRTSPELIFDQGLGDVFSVRIAGNIINSDILGSIEFGCKVVGAKIIVVLGHTRCGAVQGACDGVEMGHLTSLLKKIRPAVIAQSKIDGASGSVNHDFVENVTNINIKRTVQDILRESSILKSMVDAGECGIVGAKHNIATGEVEFFDDLL